MFNLPVGTYKLSIKEDGVICTHISNDYLVYSKYHNGFETWREYDENGNCIHVKYSDGLEIWYEYDEHGNMIHSKKSNGNEYWFNANGNEITKEEFNLLHAPCAGKVIEVEGKKYRLTAV